MKRLAAMPLLIGLLVGADRPTTDLDRLQGTWRTQQIEAEGKEVTTVGDKLVIEGDKFRASGSLIIEGVLHHRPGDPSKRLEKETHRIGGKDHRTRYVGLCSLEGDTLKECLALPGATPPTEFVSRTDSNHILDTWRRSDGKAENGLEGSWTLSDRVYVGCRQATHRNRGILMTIRRSQTDGQYHYAIRNDYEGRGRIELDPFSKPKRINLISESGYEKDHIYGIYRLQGDRFVNCFYVNQRDGRPADFTTKPGDFRWMTVYRRGNAKSATTATVRTQWKP